jgi:hypothetical protein
LDEAIYDKPYNGYMSIYRRRETNTIYLTWLFGTKQIDMPSGVTRWICNFDNETGQHYPYPELDFIGQFVFEQKYPQEAWPGFTLRYRAASETKGPIRFGSCG